MSNIRWKITRGRLEDLSVERVDAVDKPATGRHWILMKNRAGATRQHRAASRQVDDQLVAALEPVVRRVLTQGRFASEAARRISLKKGSRPEKVDPRYGLSFARELGGDVRAIEITSADGSTRVAAVEEGADPATIEKAGQKVGRGLFDSIVLGPAWVGTDYRRYHH